MEMSQPRAGIIPVSSCEDWNDTSSESDWSTTPLAAKSPESDWSSNSSSKNAPVPQFDDSDCKYASLVAASRMNTTPPRPARPENPHGAILSPSRMETWGSARELEGRPIRRLDFSSPPNPFDVPLPVASDINNNDNYFGSICNPRSAEGFVPITATERQALSATIETLDDIAARIAAGSCGSTSRDNTSLGIISQDVVSERLQDIGAEVFVDTIGCGSTTKQLGGIRPCPWYSFADMSQPETIFLQPTRPVPSAFVTPVTQGTG